MPPKGSKAGSRSLPNKTLILDNGAYAIKAGFTRFDNPPTYEDCHIIPNCLARSNRDKRVYIASELENCNDFGEIVFRRPVEKGFLVNWESEKAIWEHSFFDKNAVLQCDPRETNLILTEAPNCPNALQANCDQIVFEEFEFASYYRCIPPVLASYNDIHSLFNDPLPPQNLVHLPAECLLLIDSGYSHTIVTPVYKGQPLQTAIRRLDVGGKVLTNFLKEQSSIRHYHMMDETHLLNEIKEDVCFISDDIRRDLDSTWKGGRGNRRTIDSSLLVDYVLPDYETRKRGEARPHDPTRSAKSRLIPRPGQPREDIIVLGNERFMTPELLFNPSDIGFPQAGLPDVIMESLATLPEGLKVAMLANMVVIGGNALIKGFVERLTSELRKNILDEYPVRITRAPDPLKFTWMGGARLANRPATLKSVVVTKQQYDEHGAAWVGKQFAAAGKGKR